MLDVTDLILGEHDSFRHGFAALDKAIAPDVPMGFRTEALQTAWAALASHLERHAAAEELVVFPALLHHGVDGEHETLDAVDDHNEIRNAIRDAARHEPGAPEWWKAVGRARAENSHHMTEEEDAALPDLRRNTTRRQRVELGRAFLAAMARENVPTANTDPQDYVARHRPGTELPQQRR